MPSPSAKRTKPPILIGAPTLPSASFKRLRHALLVVEDEALIEQADFLVEGLQPELDDLLDDVGRFALRLEFVGQHVLLALDGRRIEPGRIDRLRIGGGDVHRHHAGRRP